MFNSLRPHEPHRPYLPVHHKLPDSPKPMSIELVMPSNHLILCHHLLLLPSIFLSNRFFSNESALHIRWPTYWSFSFNISPSNKHSVLISFRVDWLDLLAVQGTFKSLLQHHSSKALIIIFFFPRGKHFFLFYFILLYNTVLVLPYINMNPPQVYTNCGGGKDS